ncbi:unnamed protein product [Acanthoscelides obtectus]|uniref:Uncharacterized protein n=1 Tax=Acanthoscelides obtectus TaxID=200917 RepID=A0A9P0M1B4_ACAOB|nr:unnamed protein product [Acanthoscelides obtectus]CAK1657841.1 hypothetical protein AOBTE_LOCUS20563 [Acanthoscelides obtectus]
MRPTFQLITLTPVLLESANSEDIFVFLLFTFLNFIAISALTGVDVNISDFCLLCLRPVLGVAITDGKGLICNGVRFADFGCAFSKLADPCSGTSLDKVKAGTDKTPQS